MIVYECKVRVWYEHTDQMGVVHHSNYICYYEAARSEFMREACGLSFAEVERKGIMMPILDVHARYLRPALYDELLTVRLRIDEMPMARITFRYEILNERGELLNTGSTVLGFIRSDTRRPCRCPEWFVEMLKQRWTENTPSATGGAE